MKAVTVSLIIAAHGVNEIIRAVELLFRAARAAIRAIARRTRDPLAPAGGGAGREFTHS
jgi:hypothetical protein